MTRWTLCASSLGALLVSLLGCAEPHYDADLGVEGVPVAPGALAGTFAKVSQAADEDDVPALGQQEGGGQTFALVTRTWDGQAYAETDQVCRVVDFDVAGLHTEVSEQTAHSIPAYDVAFAVVHETGEVASDPYQEVWALTGVGKDGPLPTAPDDPHVIDMDGDGKPGATLTATGLAEGEIYVVSRKTLTLSGVVLGPDEAFGLLTHKKEGNVLDATNPLLKSEASRKPFPDPKESWWHEVRIADGAGCDAVDVSDLRPF